MIKIVKDFKENQNYTIRDRFVFILTNSLGVLGVFVKYTQAEENRDHLIKTLEKPKEDYKITKEFLECVMEAAN